MADFGSPVLVRGDYLGTDVHGKSKEFSVRADRQERAPDEHEVKKNGMMGFPRER